MQGMQVLVLHTQDDLNELKIEYLDEITEERKLNGESIYHICHVRMITQLLLEEFSLYRPECALSPEDIQAISTASTLHDIGKMQIPQNILDFPGTLSPVQYDIIKKHAPFGEKIILDAQSSEIAPDVIAYAAKIAKYHHERIDGTGYPEGLRGDEIPLCAQVVALADSYDALTSSRSYKEAMSQDVALQMIANGMCGAFDDTLVDCLMRVINHRSLVAFRETLQKKRKVVREQSELLLKRVLLLGNTEYLTADFVNRTFPQSKVMVLGNDALADSSQIKLFRVRKPSVRAILETYEFDLIVFFSGGLRFHSTDLSDSQDLRDVLQYSQELQKNIKILYLSPLDSSMEQKNDKAIMVSANEKLCEFYQSRYELDVKTVQIPYLYSGTYKEDFLHGAFEAMYSKKTVHIPEDASTKMHFLSLSDLSSLISRIVDNWTKGVGTLRVGDEFHVTFADLALKLAELDENVTVEFHGEQFSGSLKMTNAALRSEYGWFAKISILEDLPEQYQTYLNTKQQSAPTILERVKNWISAHSLWMKTLELFLLFFLSELGIYLTGSAIVFSIVDFRTIFIVIMATLYGLSFGIAAAALSSVSYFVARVMAGTNPLTMFYEPTNWLAFVLFFLVAGLCGYVALKKDDRCRYLEEQTTLLENKLIFTGELYEDTLRDKKELKKQIISSKDSFGKIFDITRKLNTVAPQQLYLKIIETFEEILENKSITVYSFKPDKPFGRLEVASRDLLDVATRSVSIDAYSPVIERLREGEIWKNTALDEKYPMYAAGVYRGSELVLMIFLWNANIDQRSLYYVNLFKILRDLVQMFLLRAYDYNEAMFDKQYVPNTHIMNAAYFEECLHNFKQLSEKKISTYLLLELGLNGHTLQEADDILFGKIRTTDVLGITSNGKVQLILSQATEKDMAVILPRFEGLGLTVTVLK